MSYLEQYMRPLNDLLNDDLVELCINPDNHVWVERRGDPHMMASDIVLSDQEVQDICTQLASTTGSTISDEKCTFSGTFHLNNWHIRAQVLMGASVKENAAVALRFYNPSSKIFDPVLLYGATRSTTEERDKRNKEMASLADDNRLLEALAFGVANKMNIVVSGGTSSGKTMVARYMQNLIPDSERIITIEDAPDLLPKQPNRVELVSRNGDPVRSPDLLMQDCLRLRPDRIILSEIRGKDAHTFLKAINTGHGGSMTTLHADTAELAVTRLAQAAMEADPGMTFAEMIKYIEQSIDVIVQTKNDGGRRGVVEIYLPKNGGLND